MYLIDGPQALKSGRILGGSQALNWWLPSIRIINNKIGKVLYQEKIPKPAYYKQEYFGKFLIVDDDAYNWKQETILRILRNPLYKGDFWVQRNDKKHFKQQTRGYIPIKERVTIPSDHEAIVDEHTWNTVQGILDLTGIQK